MHYNTPFQDSNLKNFLGRDTAPFSGVTMGWLLRLVTGARQVVGGPDSSVLFKITGEGP